MVKPASLVMPAIDKDIDWSKHCFHLDNPGLACFKIGYIPPENRDTGLFGEHFCPLDIAAEVCRHGNTGIAERRTDGGTDPGGAAGHERDTLHGRIATLRTPSRWLANNS